MVTAHAYIWPLFGSVSFPPARPPGCHAACNENPVLLTLGVQRNSGNVEVRYFDGPLDLPITGKQDLFLRGGTVVTRPEPGETLPVIRRVCEGTAPDGDYVLRFDSLEELIDYCPGEVSKASPRRAGRGAGRRGSPPPSRPGRSRCA